MCRLFAVCSPRPVSLDRAFSRLSELAKVHKHGWGVARFEASGPTIEKQTASAESCLRFRELGLTLTPTTLLAHIREASVGGVSLDNTHPFVGQGFAFMHNGTLRNFARHQTELESFIAPRWREALEGDTDSERCFALFLTELEGINEPSLEQLAKALARVMHRAASICDVDAPAPSALNFIVSDGQRMVATCRGRTLNVLSDGDSHFISSEQLWPAGWAALEDDDVIGIDERFVVHRWRVPELMGQAR